MCSSYNTSHPRPCKFEPMDTLHRTVTDNNLALSASRKIICVIATRVQCSTVPHLGVNSRKAISQLALHCMKVKSEVPSNL